MEQVFLNTVNMGNLLIRPSLATGNIKTACCQFPQPVFSFVKPSFPWLPQEVQWFVPTAGQGPLSCQGLRCGFQRWEGSSSRVMPPTCGFRINGLLGCMDFLTTGPPHEPCSSHSHVSLEPRPAGGGHGTLSFPTAQKTYNWSGRRAFLLATLLKGSEHRLPCQGFCPDSRRTS